MATKASSSPSTPSAHLSFRGTNGYCQVCNDGALVIHRAIRRGSKAPGPTSISVTPGNATFSTLNDVKLEALRGKGSITVRTPDRPRGSKVAYGPGQTIELTGGSQIFISAKEFSVFLAAPLPGPAQSTMGEGGDEGCILD